MARHPNIVAPPAAGKEGCEKWTIEGKEVTYRSLLSRAADRGVKISLEVVRRRLKRGVNTFDALLAPPEEVPEHMHKALKTKRERAKAEMAELLAQMGPAKHY